MYSSDFKIFCICESWLLDSVYDQEILPSNYIIYRKDRPSRGGGVLVAVNNVFESMCLPSPSDLETVTIKIGCSLDLILCTSYVPPNPSDMYICDLLDYFTELMSLYSNCIFVGDFNCPDIDWFSLTAQSHFSNSFCEFIFDYNLTQHVNVPTHIKGNILDLVLTSPSLIIDDLVIQSPPVILSSDHSVISFSLMCDVSVSARSKPGYVYNHSKADYHGMCAYLMDVDFSFCLTSLDIEFVWCCIISVIYKAMFLFIPKVYAKCYQGPKWHTPAIRHHINCLRTLKKRFKSHPTLSLKQKIQHLEESLQQEMVSAKSVFEWKLIERLKSGNSSAVYRYIRNLTGSNGIPQSVYFKNVSASMDSDKASLFNQYFHSVYGPVQDLPLSHDLPKPSQSFGDISIDELDVYEVLMSLDTSKAMGCDGISPMLLKHCAIPLLQPLHHLFTLSLIQSYLPSQWRSHLIKPILKSGPIHLVENYRPISLLCIVSKVLEKIVHKKLVDYVLNSISDSQFGFLHDRSSLQQLLIFFKLLTNRVSNKSQVDVIYLDFKKAFDSVSHNKLLQKVWAFGITGNVWHWLRAYLTNRIQCVTINGILSDALPVSSGVPQGSILGPLLFLIYINDFPSSIELSHVLLFADDVKCALPVSSPNDSYRLQQDLSKLLEWSHFWELPLNESKCTTMHFHFQNFCSYDYYLNNLMLPFESFHRDLGVVFSENLKWGPHYKLIVSRAYKILGLLRRVFYTISCVQSKRTLYLSLVKPHLLYCSSLWRPHLLSDIRCLETVQRRATKFIIGSNSLDYKERLLNLNILPLMMDFEIRDIIFFIKCVKTKYAHLNIHDFVTFSTSKTRSSTYFKLRHSKSANIIQSNEYFNRIPRLWNSLPQIDMELSISTLKAKLKKFFWQHFTVNFDPNNACTFYFLCPCNKCSKCPVSMRFSSCVL